ncbi:hypothetical protein [Rhodococcus sp. IEGM 1379]|uniref:hypothetical protein n=1 Tax=Rhodococcus sp. IEGM 1379 TaxID=3047086 RepID=UPI0024B799D5|nr:hypothetical protein [Rhodococcus sp. IEGM 1379]MDI9914383.1 hypothetical protein [Rhodococcus sp. IEGM 1379]
MDIEEASTPSLDAEEATPLGLDFVDIDVSLGQSIGSVLDKLTELDGQEPRGRSFDPLQNAIVTSYRQLLLSENDLDGHFRRRLDLIRGFAYPTFTADDYAIFASAVGTSAGYAPQLLWYKRIFTGDKRAVNRSTLSSHMASLSSLLARNDVRTLDDVALALFKRRIDTWIAGIVSQSLRQHNLSTEGLIVFQRLADRIRDSDAMTDPDGTWARDLERLGEARQERRGVSGGDAIRVMSTAEPDTELNLTEVFEKALQTATEVETIRDRAKGALGATLQAAGHTAEVALGADFARVATRNGRVAGVLSGLSIVMLLLVCYAGFRTIGKMEDIDLVDELAKFSLTLPLLAIAAYLGRLSSHYRESARWAHTASVQLMSVDAFAEGLSSEKHRDELKLALGARVFGDPGFGVQAKNPDVEDVVAIIDSVGIAVRPKE